MEKPICLLLFSLLSLSLLVGSYASDSAEACWKLMLPNTPMPQSIKDSLPFGPPAAAESSSKTTDGHGELVADTKGSLKTLSGYIGLLSYIQEKWIPAQAGYFSNQNKPLASNNGYLSYNQGKFLPDQAGYGGGDSDDEQKKEPLDNGYLSYNQGKFLPDQAGYGGSDSDDEQKKEPLAPDNGYLSYDQEKSLETDHGYLSYDNQKKEPLASDNAYLSYNQEKSLETDHGYLSYDNQKKEPLASNNGYLSYNKPESKSTTKVSSSQVQDIAMKNRQFFMEKNLQIGNKKNLEFKIGTNKAVFLPREVSDTIPFSSNKLQETLRLLSLDPKSEKAYILSRAIKLCEEPKVQGVEKQCVTSLESMVDYVTSKLGKNVKAMSTKVEKDAKGEYKIVGVNKLTKEDHETVVCHKMNYPYAVYFCHTTDTIRSYMVSLVGEDGAKMEAVSACHKEINAVLEDYEINVLKVKPRSARICHFPNSESIIWVRN